MIHGDGKNNNKIDETEIDTLNREASKTILDSKKETTDLVIIFKEDDRLKVGM